jgi:hypothetical protein
MRRHISSKSGTCTESLYVYAAGISVKVRAHYSTSLGEPVKFLGCLRRIVYRWNGRFPAVYGTVRTVVWEDGGGDSASYPILAI